MEPTTAWPAAGSSPLESTNPLQTSKSAMFPTYLPLSGPFPVGLLSSFNYASLAQNSFEQNLIVVNTIISLTGSVLGTYIISALSFGRGLDMENILNATIAGGVVMGASCSFIYRPGVALFIGCSTGMISTFCFPLPRTQTSRLHESLRHLRHPQPSRSARTPRRHLEHHHRCLLRHWLRHANINDVQ